MIDFEEFIISNKIYNIWKVDDNICFYVKSYTDVDYIQENELVRSKMYSISEGWCISGFFVKYRSISNFMSYTVKYPDRDTYYRHYLPISLLVKNKIKYVEVDEEGVVWIDIKHLR